MADDADRAIGHLQERGCDFCILLWLRNMETVKSSHIGGDLLKFLKDVDINPATFLNNEFRRDFFGRCRQKLVQTGIRPVSPNNFVVAANRGGKLGSIERAAQSNWPRPYQPFCFQTLGTKDTLFFVFQCWQDGLIMMSSILKDRKFMFEDREVPVSQIYEHCWGDDRISRLLIDWESLESWYGGRRTAAQIRESALAFPGWFVRRLVDAGALDKSVRVRCVVKDKSRSVVGKDKVTPDNKISFHFILDIAGVPRMSHNSACKLALDGVVKQIQIASVAGSFAGIPDDQIGSPWLGVDWRTQSGGHGFSVPFSRKKVTDPVPIVPFVYILTYESQETTPLPWGNMDEVQTLSEGSRLDLFYHTSYTTPVAGTESYGGAFVRRIREAQVNHI